MTDQTPSADAQELRLEPELRKALEAILLVVDEPVGVDTLAQVLEVGTDEVEDGLITLAAEYAEQGRGFVLRRSGGGWRYYTDPGAAEYVERFVLHGRSGRLTQAALETLAIIAYKQPVTRSEISEIRGVDADAGVRTLRISGPDRYATAAVTADRAIEDGVDPAVVWVATGRRFPDALAASAAVADGGILLLADGRTEEAEDLLGVIATHRDDVERLVLIGGPAALADALEARLRGLLGS